MYIHNIHTCTCSTCRCVHHVFLIFWNILFFCKLKQQILSEEQDRNPVDCEWRRERGTWVLGVQSEEKRDSVTKPLGWDTPPC